MAGSFGDYLENQVLNHTFGGDAFSPVDPLFLGLSKTTINEDGTGITEPVGGAYVRLPVASTIWTPSTTGTIDNNADLEFAEATGIWGIIIYLFITDVVTGVGNMYCYSDLTNPREILSGDIIRFKIGNLTMTLG